MKKRVGLTAGFFLSACLLAGCQQGFAPVHVSVETEAGDVVEIVSTEKLDGTLKQTDSGFTVDTSEDAVTGKILTGIEADVLNGENYDSEGYTSISVQDQAGFAFTTDTEPVAYVHVFRIPDSDLYVQLTSDVSDSVLYAVESGLTIQEE